MNTFISPPRPEIDRNLIPKYTVRGPRYTSYPTAPEWKADVGPTEYWKHIRETNASGAVAPLSLYVHIPFCAERCFYCACNVIITQRGDVIEDYVDYLIREIELIANEIAPGRSVVQFHLGGGTPTQLPPRQLDRVLACATNQFSFAENAERSIEVDLRITNTEHLHVLRRYGFNRISTGVQDFNAQTQELIRRKQSVEETVDFVNQCREMGFESVNFDLVYGLPLQTARTFGETIEKICVIDPDRIALYNYAHLPSKMPFQKRIDESTLPSADERLSIFQGAIERFTDKGYVYIGMDHFAKPDDELTLAQREGTLQRNFMGFTTRAGADLYAFGVSSISALPALYAQNTKNLKRYKDAIDAGVPPVERGMELSRDDRIRRWVIMELMCNLRISLERFQAIWNEDFRRYFEKELSQLQPFIDDELIEPDLEREIRVTGIGQIVIRPIAMVFDKYLQRGGKPVVFSRTL